ncbi:MAG: hypothetical protein GY938_00995 [Ketobacter sp.]|nr:hypothetical protein [Ketobacter sp.]
MKADIILLMLCCLSIGGNFTLLFAQGYGWWAPLNASAVVIGVLSVAWLWSDIEERLR